MTVPCQRPEVNSSAGLMKSRLCRIVNANLGNVFIFLQLLITAKISFSISRQGTNKNHRIFTDDDQTLTFLQYNRIGGRLFEKL